MIFVIIVCIATVINIVAILSTKPYSLDIGPIDITPEMLQCTWRIAFKILYISPNFSPFLRYLNLLYCKILTCLAHKKAANFTFCFFAVTQIGSNLVSSEGVHHLLFPVLRESIWSKNSRVWSIPGDWSKNWFAIIPWVSGYLPVMFKINNDKNGDKHLYKK